MSNPVFPSSFFPGMGDAAASDNPLLSGMAMMRQAWGGLAGAGQLAQALPLGPTLDPQELARRIDELRTVENWLNLNLSLLRSSIQGLEVQQATINTLQSFLGSAAAAGHSTAPTAGPAAATTGSAAAAPSPEPAPAAASENAGAKVPASDPALQAAQAWWDIMQQQFQGFAAAAAAAAPVATEPTASATDKASVADEPVASKTVARPAARKPAAKRATAARGTKAPSNGGRTKT